MSAYLNFYLVDKQDNPMEFCSFSRNHPIYSAVNEVVNVAFGGETYTDLTSDRLNDIMIDIDSEVGQVERKIAEYERLANGNIEVINEIINWKEYVEELKEPLFFLRTLRVILADIDLGYTSFKGIKMNIT